MIKLKFKNIVMHLYINSKQLTADDGHWSHANYSSI